MKRLLAVVAIVLGIVGCNDSDSDVALATPPTQGQPTQPAARLQILIIGDGRGRVSTAPGGQSCEQSCEIETPADTTITLGANAADRSRFAGWGGACQSSHACSVSGTGAQTVTARFEPTPPSGRWFAGDGHVHDDHSSDGSFLRQLFDDTGPGTTATDDQIGFGVSQQLDWMVLTDHRTYDQHWDPTWDSGQVLLIAGEEANGSPHCTVFGAIDTAVQGDEPENDPGFRTIQQSIWDVRAQGALWNQAHPDRRSYDRETDTPTAKNYASQIGQSLAEIWNKGENPESEIDYAENRWNRGWRFGVVGASDNHDRLLWSISGPGKPTTWVYAADRTERGLLTAMAAGRTVVSAERDGPFPNIEADAQGDGIFEGIVGSELLTRPNQDIELRISARNAIGNRVLVYQSPGRDEGPGNPIDLVLEFEPSEDESTRTIKVKAPATGHRWWYVMVRGPSALPSGLEAPTDLPDQLRAATSPIFVSVTGDYAEPVPEVAIPADRAQADGAHRLFGADTGFAGFADLASSDFATHYVAEAHTQTATQIVYRRRDTADEFSAITILSESAANARFPRIAVSGLDVWVVWQEDSDTQRPRRPRIRLKHSGDGGLSWETTRTLSNGAGRAMHPAIALMPDGGPVVVWQDNARADGADGLGAFDVFAFVVGRDAQPINLSGAAKQTRVANPLDTRSARYPASLFPAVAVSKNATIAVAWQDNRYDQEPLWTGQAGRGEGTDPDDWEILVATRTAQAENWSTPVNASNDASRADWHADVAFTDSSELVVAWDAKRNDDSSGRDLYIRSARSDEQGAHFSAVVDVTAESEPGMARRPAFGRRANGALTLSWSDSRSADWRWRIFAADVTADGFAAPVRVTGPGNATFQRLAAGELVFTSDRALQRVQRDNRFGVFSVSLR